LYSASTKERKTKEKKKEEKGKEGNRRYKVLFRQMYTLSSI
jgi:hypothetical protein